MKKLILSSSAMDPTQLPSTLVKQIIWNFGLRHLLLLVGLIILGSIMGYGNSVAFAGTNPEGQPNAPDITDLGVLGGTVSQGTGINERGDIVGASTTDTDEMHAFLLPAKSKMVDLGVLGQLNGTTGFSAAASVSEAGTVAGTSTTLDSLHAFLWTSKNGMRDLGFLAEFISPQGAIGLSVAAAMSRDKHYVVGTSTTANSFSPDARS